MAAYAWPGNIREMENAIERGVILCKGEYVTLGDLPETLTRTDSGRGASVGPIVSLKNEMDKCEKRVVEEALKRNGFNRNRTCRMLKINRTTLYNKMRRHAISVETSHE